MSRQRGCDGKRFRDTDNPAAIYAKPVGNQIVFAHARVSDCIRRTAAVAAYESRPMRSLSSVWTRAGPLSKPFLPRAMVVGSIPGDTATPQFTGRSANRSLRHRAPDLSVLLARVLQWISAPPESGLA